MPSHGDKSLDYSPPCSPACGGADAARPKTPGAFDCAVFLYLPLLACEFLPSECLLLALGWQLLLAAGRQKENVPPSWFNPAGPCRDANTKHPSSIPRHKKPQDTCPSSYEAVKVRRKKKLLGARELWQETLEKLWGRDKSRG